MKNSETNYLPLRLLIWAIETYSDLCYFFHYFRSAIKFLLSSLIIYGFGALVIWNWSLSSESQAIVWFFTGLIIFFNLGYRIFEAAIMEICFLFYILTAIGATSLVFFTFPALSDDYNPIAQRIFSWPAVFSGIILSMLMATDFFHPRWRKKSRKLISDYLFKQFNRRTLYLISALWLLILGIGLDLLLLSSFLKPELSASAEKLQIVGGFIIMTCLGLFMLLFFFAILFAATAYLDENHKPLSDSLAKQKEENEKELQIWQSLQSPNSPIT